MYSVCYLSSSNTHVHGIPLQDIFRKYPNKYETIISTLCENLDSLDEPEARAAMIWIVGEYAERIDNADEILQSFLDAFHDENTQVLLVSNVEAGPKRRGPGGGHYVKIHELFMSLLSFVKFIPPSYMPFSLNCAPAGATAAADSDSEVVPEEAPGDTGAGTEGALAGYSGLG